MRFIFPIAVIACAAPAGASILVHGAGLATSFAAVAASLPDPATAAIMFGGLGLVAGARRLRSNAVSD
jgi:hypothetical protein